jgi:hypothetical protein
MEMKNLILTLLIAGILAPAIYAQGVPGAEPRLRTSAPPGFRQADEDLPRFDLDFAGGTPQRLVEKIEEKIRNLNVIIPTEYKDAKLPPLKMHSVNVRQLFEALEFANQKTYPYQSASAPGTTFINQQITTMGFRTSGPITPESVWYFYVSKPQPMEFPKVVRYYQLSPYLTEYKIDDITTAIQAGWKMLGEEDAPNLNFHQDTKLLIAVGQLSQLNMIDSVLQELNKTLSAEVKTALKAATKPERSK